MPKSIFRFVALFLVSCLILDPGTVSAFSVGTPATHVATTHLALFNQQALASRALNALADIFGRKNVSPTTGELVSAWDVSHHPTKKPVFPRFLSAVLAFAILSGQMVAQEIRNAKNQISPSINAWLANFHDGSALNALRSYGARLKELSIFSVGGDRKGHLTPNKTYLDNLMSELHRMEHPPRVLITVTNDRARRSKDHRLLVQWIGNEMKREQHIKDLLQLAQQADGLDVDYENMKPRDAPYFERFISELGHALHAQGKYLTVTVEIKTLKSENIHWGEVSANVDRVRVMAYQYHFGRTAPGAVSPPDEVLSLADFALGIIPAAKLEIALPIYGFDWTVDAKGRRRGRGKLVGTIDRYKELTSQNNAEVFRDPGTHAARIVYSVSKGGGKKKHMTLHQVWFEDPASVIYKIGKLSEKGIAHVGLWQLSVGDISNLFESDKTQLPSEPEPSDIKQLPSAPDPHSKQLTGGAAPNIGSGSLKRPQIELLAGEFHDTFMERVDRKWQTWENRFAPSITSTFVESGNPDNGSSKSAALASSPANAAPPRQETGSGATATDVSLDPSVAQSLLPTSEPAKRDSDFASLSINGIEFALNKRSDEAITEDVPVRVVLDDVRRNSKGQAHFSRNNQASAELYLMRPGYETADMVLDELFDKLHGTNLNTVDSMVHFLSKSEQARNRTKEKHSGAEAIGGTGAGRTTVGMGFEGNEEDGLRPGYRTRLDQKIGREEIMAPRFGPGRLLTKSGNDWTGRRANDTAVPETQVAHSAPAQENRAVYYSFSDTEVQRYVDPAIVLLFDVAKELKLDFKLSGGAARDFAIMLLERQRRPLPRLFDFDIFITFANGVKVPAHYTEADFKRFVAAYQEAFRKQFPDRPFPDIDFSRMVHTGEEYVYENMLHAVPTAQHPLIADSLSGSKLVISIQGDRFVIEDSVSAIGDVRAKRLRIISNPGQPLHPGDLGKMLGKWSQYRDISYTFDEPSMQLIDRSLSQLAHGSPKIIQMFWELLLENCNSWEDALATIDVFRLGQRIPISERALRDLYLKIFPTSPAAAPAGQKDQMLLGTSA